MKKLILILALLVPVAARAQLATQPSPSHLDAAQLVATSATSASTITITPPSGQFVYIGNIEITDCAGTVVTAAAPTTLTTTNLGGAAWTIGSGSTAGQCQPSPATGSFAALFRSAVAGTAVTFVLPPFVTQQTVRVSVYYYFAP